MAESYKILGQGLTGELALDNVTIKETVVYEVPTATKASISTIQITNSDVASQTYRLAFVPNADSDIIQSSNKHIAIYNKTIASGETHEIKGGITLSSGDQIRAYSDSNDLIVNVYGTEITSASLDYKILGQQTIENYIEVVS